MSLTQIEKKGFKHFMLKEVMEQPRVLEDCMRGRVNAEAGTLRLGGIESVMDKLKAATRFVICACGTSWHSALVGEYVHGASAGGRVRGARRVDVGWSGVLWGAVGCCGGCGVSCVWVSCVRMSSRQRG